MAEKEHSFQSCLDGALEQAVSCSLEGCGLRWKQLVGVWNC